MTVRAERVDASDSHWWTIGVVSLASLMVGLDVLVLMTALPTMRVDLDASTADLGWTINAYEIGYAALILTGATLGDIAAGGCCSSSRSLSSPSDRPSPR